MIKVNVPQLKRSLGSLAIVLAVAVVGVAAAAYVLINERLPVPFSDTYSIEIELSGVDGVVPGQGQPVNVAGVQIGTISDARLGNGNALITAEIKRAELPEVFRDARAELEPVTPLKDMQITLDPGHQRAGRLPDGGTIRVARTGSPLDFDDLFAALDTETRMFLGSLISSLSEGSAGNGKNLRRLLISLGPTTRQVRKITQALAKRRVEIARLVHNLSVVTHAASRDAELATVVKAGSETLEALAERDRELGQSVAALPGTLATVREALVETTELANELGPTLDELEPAVRELPATFEALGPFADDATAVLNDELRPFAVAAQPALRRLGPATQKLSAMTPRLSTSFQGLNYLVNELAYNPGTEAGGQGGLFWLAWFAHNVNSLTANQDAHGVIGRATTVASCEQLTGAGDAGVLLGVLTGTSNVCNS